MRVIGVLLLMATVMGCGDDVSAPEVPHAALELRSEDVVLVRNAWSGYDVPVRAVIRTEAQWADTWERLYRHALQPPARPAVNFADEMIVLAAMGQRPSTGYTVQITGTSLHQNTLYVRITERMPGQTCGVGLAVTAPVHVVKLPRHEASPVFIVQRETFSC
jgi:hypothetical protein